MVIPDPIPNSEVKHARANDTLAHASGKVGGCPFMTNSSIKRGVFLFYIYDIIKKSLVSSKNGCLDT